MSNYLIELSVIHIALIVGYWFFLRRERQYYKMRFYLLAATLVALVIPLLKLPRLFYNSNEAINAVPMEAISLDAMTIYPIEDMSIWSFDLFIWAYLAISLFLFLRLLSGMFYLISLARRSSYEKFNDLHIRKVRNIEGSFTFFSWIFLSAEIDQDRQDYELILKHEQAHASLGHSYDIMFFELFKVCFWWLPTAWFITKEIKKIHEYQADAYALKSCNVDQYSSILITSTLKTHGVSLPTEKKQALRQAGLPAGKRQARWQAGLTSSFHDGLILKRLKAMKQQAKNVRPWKLWTLSVLSVSLFIVFACSEDLDQDLKEIGSKSNSITFDQLPPAMQADLADIKDELSFMRVDVSEHLTKATNIEQLQELDPKLIHSLHVVKNNSNSDKGAIYVALKKDGANFDYLSDKTKVDVNVFTVVEKQPETKGGIEALRRYIADEMKYPLQARQRGVEGQVDVQFTIEKDGSLSDVTAINGIGAGCDEEAIRLVKNAPSFTPGMQNGKPVRVRMVMPIIFKLNGSKANEHNSTQGTATLGEVHQNGSKFNVEAEYADGAWAGAVYDEKGNGLPGVNVVVVGTTTGTASDQDGTFKIKADPSNDLSLSFIGYESVRLEGR